MRTPMITRTVKAFEITCKVMINDEVIETRTFTLSARIPAEKRLAVLKKENDSDTLTVIKIVDTKSIEAIYGMTETEFLSVAHLLTDDRKIAEQ